MWPGRGRAQCGRRGGELCNEGMLRKQGPTDSLTTYDVSIWNLLSLPFCVEIGIVMYDSTNRNSITIE